MKKILGIILVVTTFYACNDGDSGGHSGQTGIDSSVHPLPDNSATNANTGTFVTDSGTNNAQLDTNLSDGAGGDTSRQQQ